jgi:hypothetical protein
MDIANRPQIHIEHLEDGKIFIPLTNITENEPVC